jgi:type IX secretion system PorP/SprF family membrane protein
MKQILFFLTILLTASFGFSQQDPQFAHNVQNQGFTNPGYAGLEGLITANVINRQQWVGFTGAPVTTLADINSDFKMFGRTNGIGFSILNDKQGFEKEFQAKLAYSYHQQIGNGKLGIGIEFGMINFSLSGTYTPPQVSPEQDPLIPNKDVRKMIFDLGLGLFYKAGDFYAGFSTAHIQQPKIAYPEIEASFLKRNFYGTVGYNFRFFNTPIELSPSVFVKSDGVKTAQDYNILGTYNKKFYLGVTYRNQDALVPMIGFQLYNGLRIGYAYELSISKLRTANSGTHEFLVGYSFELYKPTTNNKYKSVRFL